MARLVQLLCLLAVSVFAGYESLSSDMKLFWTFTSDDIIEFTFKFKTDEAEDYDWWGFGIKEDDQGYDMSASDLFIIRKNGEVDDRFGSDNEYPSSDVSVGGTNDLSVSSHGIVDEFYVTKFSRPLNTGDSNDIVLRKGRRYIVIYAYGALQRDDYLEHDNSDDGWDRIVLEEDYDDEDENDDEEKDKFAGNLVALTVTFLCVLTLIMS